MNVPSASESGGKRWKRNDRAGPLNYYNHHIGDYAKDTAHLSMVEHGAYRMLLDICYATERPLPAEPRAVYRLVRAVTKIERQAVDAVLTDYFEKKNDGWHQKRCDEEIAYATEKSQKARDSADKRWHGKSNTNAYAKAGKNAMPTQCDGNTPSTSSTPIASTPRTNKTKTSSADFNHPTRPSPDSAPLQEKNENQKLSPHVEMAVKLRELGITVSASHPQVHDWIQDGVTVAMAVDAVSIARMRKPEGTIAPKYLAPIIADMLDQKSINGSSHHSAGEWWETVGGIRAKADELKVSYSYEPGFTDGENFTILKALVFLAAGDGPWIDSRDQTMQRIMEDIRQRRVA